MRCRCVVVVVGVASEVQERTSSARGGWLVWDTPRYFSFSCLYLTTIPCCLLASLPSCPVVSLPPAYLSVCRPYLFSVHPVPSVASCAYGCLSARRFTRDGTPQQQPKRVLECTDGDGSSSSNSSDASVCPNPAFQGGGEVVLSSWCRSPSLTGVVWGSTITPCSSPDELIGS